MGVGIGLAIAKQSIQHHGGRIVLTNREDGSGLHVTITLPLADQ